MIFPGCASTGKDVDLKWHGVPNKPKHPSLSKPGFAQVRKYHIKNKTRFVLTNKLGSNSKKLKKPRWCSNHLAAKPLKTKVSFTHNGKRHAEAFDVYLVPDPLGHKNLASFDVGHSSKSKGVGVDRHNRNFFENLDANE